MILTRAAQAAAAGKTARSAVKRVAVVLSGSGVYDGSEVHEASAVLVALGRNSALSQVFAPDKPQMHVVNHLAGKPEEGSSRNVLAESARIARGNAKPLTALKVDDYDALIFPGGFGAAKNLSDFAVKGADATVDPNVASLLKGFVEAKKPVGLCCIAPTLAALVLKDVTVTVGSDKEGPQWPHAGAAAQIKKLGAKHVVCDITQICVDEKNKIVTAPAFMCEAPVHEVHDNVAQMVNKVLDLAR